MSATSWLVVRLLRPRWAALIPLALVVAVGGTGAFVAIGAADRTADAYPRYLERADVGEVLVNPSLNTSDIDRVVRSLPGVRSVTSTALFVAGIDEGTPRPRGEVIEEAQAQVYGSVDGRFTTMDRPVLAEGRLPTDLDEALVNVDLADARGVEVGDVLPLSFWRSRDDFVSEPEEEVISPVAVHRVTVVGIATLPDEVLPERLFPRERIIVSPELARRYDCIPDVPPADASFEQAVEGLYPDGCSTSYRYYSLDVVGGESGVGRVLDTFLRRAADATRALPRIMTSEAPDSPTYYLVATTTADERERVDRSMQPIATALGVLGVAAGAVTAVVIGLAVARELRRTADDRRQWWRLGVARRQHAVVVAVPLLLAVVIGLAAALVLAWALSPVGPVGSVRSVEPSPDRELSEWIGVAALVLVAVCALGIAALAVRAAMSAGQVEVGRRDAQGRPQRVRMLARPDVDHGLRAAYGSGRGAWLVVASCGLAVGTFLAAVVFGASLSTLLTTPASYGWPWDLGVMTGFGYGDLDRESVARTLDRHPDVENWTELGFTNDLSLDGEPVPTVVAPELRRGVDFAVVEGRLPQGEDEVALGARTAAERGLAPGDRASLSGGGVEGRRVTITGIAVLPPLGQFQSDRTDPGTGVVLPVAFEPEGAAGLLSFVGIDLVPDADPAAVFAELHEEFVTWDLTGSPPVEYREPVRPAEIVNVQSMRAVPLVVGGLLAGTAVVGLTVAVVVSVRSRHRELAILRALGFTQRQVRTSVRAQAVATMSAAVLLGVPLGIAAGRVAWQAFASQLGVLTVPSTPGWWIAATVLASFVVALVAAAVPARVAGRVRPATALRTE